MERVVLETPKTKLFKTKSLLGNRESIQNFFIQLQKKYKLNTPERWNSIKKKHILANGGSLLLKKYSMFEIKCMACPEGKSTFTNPPQSIGYWDNQENIDNFLSKIKQKYNLNTPEDWNSITQKHIKANGGSSLLPKHSIFEIKCMACPEGKSIFTNPKQASGYWESQENVLEYLSKIKEKYNLNTPEDWNSITKKQIQSNGGGSLLNKYSMFEIKCMACPEGKSTFNNPPQSSGYWEHQENILNFLSKIKQKYSLNTPEDWQSITKKHILANGGRGLLSKYSLFELLCMACPEGKATFNNPKQSSGYWENKENIDNFLLKIKEKHNLNTPEDWNTITTKRIQSNGGGSLLLKYSMFELKCMACPEGKSTFNNPKQSSRYWENQENILNFFSTLKQKYNLDNPEDWNSITWKHIQSNGGSSLLNKYSMLELKCMACPEGKSTFNNPKQSSGYWKNRENILKYLSKIKEKYNLNTPEDWNSITYRHIKDNGGGSLLSNYSMFEIKCMACPEGKSIFDDPPQAQGYWENKENILNFLSKIKEKYNLHTPEDWDSITQKQIKANGGSTLLLKYSLYDIKLMACPEGKSTFNRPKQSSKYWDNKENILNFLLEIKEKYNLNNSEDWNSITSKHIKSNGGSSLLSKYSMFELKCMACPEGKLTFNNPKQVSGYWNNQENIDNFLSKIKEKHNLHTPEDWKRFSKNQIRQEGGSGLLFSKLKIRVKFETPNGTTKFIPLSTLLSGSGQKRSSQRWLFLQIQKLFPHEEIVEDYFHPEISRISGANVQFDIFMIERNIAIEYHGIQHYEDNPASFSPAETYKYRDLEKQKLCSEHGIQLIVIPYWWDNKLDSLRQTLYSKIQL